MYKVGTRVHGGAITVDGDVSPQAMRYRHAVQPPLSTAHSMDAAINSAESKVRSRVMQTENTREAVQHLCSSLFKPGDVT